MDKTPKQIVIPVVERVAERLDLEVDRVEISASRKQSILRVFLDKEGGITLQDCEKASREIRTILDVEDLLNGNYTLEVGSPGLDRPLLEERDYVRFAGRLVHVHTYAPIEKNRDFVGKLLGLEDGVVRLQLKDKETSVEIPLDTISKARLEVEI